MPDEIQLMQVISSEPGGADGVLDYYLFRFRVVEPHVMAKDGWMAGVAGPFARKDAPSSDSLGGTFSNFERWDAKPPKEHADDIRKTLEEWAAKRGSGNEP